MHLVDMSLYYYYGKSKNKQLIIFRFVEIIVILTKTILNKDSKTNESKKVCLLAKLSILKRHAISSVQNIKSQVKFIFQ